MNRSRLVVGVVLTAAIALFGLSGCARLRNGASTDDTTTASWDAQALESAGFTVDDVSDSTATPAPNASNGANAANGKRFKRLKFAFQHTLHGEATVQTEEGLKTVVVQRGTVTAKTD